MVKTSATATTLAARITATMIALAGIPSVSGQENAAREYARDRLVALGIEPQADSAGNLIARVPARPAERDDEAPILLNAHLDRVPPGKAHTPVLQDGILRSDGETNLGADDSAGIAILLHTIEELQVRAVSHPPLLVLFTVGEEVGLVGAKAFDPEPWGAREGIIFDNAGEPGEVVTRAATIIAFDVTLHGSGGHPGKRLAGTTSAIEIFRRAQYPFGELEDGQSRVSIGRVKGGSARNAVPREMSVQGEARTLLEGEARAELQDQIARAFMESATALGGAAEIEFDAHCAGYEVTPDEPLLLAWEAAVVSRGESIRTMTTFIGSDASALRPRMRVFTVSTGAMNEHTSEEWIALAPLAGLVETTLALLGAYHAE
jgi:tripeptide aminopeptidase